MFPAGSSSPGRKLEDPAQARTEGRLTIHAAQAPRSLTINHRPLIVTRIRLIAAVVGDKINPHRALTIPADRQRQRGASGRIGGIKSQKNRSIR
jgi:hypothetical protein